MIKRQQMQWTLIRGTRMMDVSQQKPLHWIPRIQVVMQMFWLKTLLKVPSIWFRAPLKMLLTTLKALLNRILICSEMLRNILKIPWMLLTKFHLLYFALSLLTLTDKGGRCFVVNVIKGVAASYVNQSRQHQNCQSKRTTKRTYVGPCELEAMWLWISTKIVKNW